MNREKNIHDSIRHQKMLRVEGWVCDTLECFLQQYPDHSFPSRYLFSDLSMGVWRAHQVASEFQMQLPGRPGLPAGASQPSTGSGLLFADITGQGIDEESRMDKPWKEGWSRVRRFMEEISGSGDLLLGVILPVTGSPLHQDNEIFLYLLGHSLRETGHRLFFISRDIQSSMVTRNIHVTWHAPDPASSLRRPAPGLRGTYLSLYPGILPDRPEASLAGRSIRLREGCFLVPPECRCRPGMGDRLRFDQLAMAYRPDDNVRAYAQYHGNTLFADPPFLASYAWKQFSMGGKEVAFLFLARAWKCTSDPLEKAIILSQLQGLRIALWQFEAVAQETLPSGTIPVSLRRFLLLAGGWGSVMTGRIEEADRCFQQARDLFLPEQYDTREYLYLENISALCRLKKGEPEAALEMEHRIEEVIDRQEEKDHRLLYVNAINTARLYRKKGNFDRALLYYRKAFRTIEGLQQDSDLVYTNLVLSIAHRDSGDWELSFIRLLRAAMHWLSNAFPFVLSKRLFVVMGFPASCQDDPASLHLFETYFLEKLQDHPYFRERFGELAELTGPVCDWPATRSAPLFLNGLPFNGKIKTAFGIPGLSVFLPEGPVPGPGERQTDPPNPLSVFVYKLCLRLFPGLTISAGEAATLIVDSNAGFDIPFCLEELLSLCERLDVENIWWKDQWIERAGIPAALFALHPGVDRIENEGTIPVVLFRRYYPPVSLPPLLAPVVDLLFRMGVPVSRDELFSGIPSGERAGHIGWLEEKKIIYRINPVNQCIKDGSRSASNGTSGQASTVSTLPVSRY
jgi:tetratricopeptide (TPR) repeat protein